MTAPGRRYDVRFDASEYAEDEPVGVFAHPDDPDAVWVPERLFWRLVFVARGYSLHTLPLLGGPEPVVLNALQVESLLDEVAFVAALLDDDPLVVDLATRLNAYLRRVLAAGPDATVTIEGN